MWRVEEEKDEDEKEKETKETKEKTVQHSALPD